MAASPSRPRAPRRSPLRLLARALGAVGLGAASVAVTVSLVGVVVSGSGQAVTTDEAEPVLLKPLATRSIVYDAAGNEMALLFAEEDRQEVPLSAVPDEVQRTVLAVEDEDFYSHKGISIRSIVRAVSSDVSAGGVEQGGSTITQQLIKNAVTGGQQTIERKIREAVLAVRLEQQMTKHQILERYLNTVYLGHGAYGLQAAAETYFDKDVDELGWPEAAMLAALIRNPTGYSPVSYPERAAERRRVVVRRLLSVDAIDQRTADRILDTPLPDGLHERSRATAQAQLVGGGYFSETVKQFLLDLPALGETSQDRYNAVFGGGLRVHTTYDPVAQRQAELAVTKVPDTDGEFFAGLAAVDRRTGAVRAMVGGPDFETSKVNYVTQGWRQPGSSFKFFVLMAAFEAGYVPDDTISGSSPCRFPDPTAEGGVYQATGGGRTTTITGQTQVSSNCGFLRLGQTVGLDRVADVANRMGVTTVRSVVDDEGTARLEEIPVPSSVLSLPLGTKEVHPIAMAAAYATAANDGVYNPPYYVERVTDARGKVLWRHESQATRVVSVETARLVTEVLEANATGGTGRRAALEDQPSAGKTGTTQENADAWYVGFTPYLSTAVWLGSPQGQQRIVIRGKAIYGADYPATVWNAFNEAYHADLPVVEFTEPEATRRGKAIRYRNKLDSGASRPRSTTTTVPDGGEPGPEGTSPPASTPQATNPPATSPPATSPPATAAPDD